MSGEHILLRSGAVQEGRNKDMIDHSVCKLEIEGKICEYPRGITFQEIAREYQHKYEDEIILVCFQNNLKELKKMVTRDGTLELVTAGQKAGRSTYRRSMTFLMETAADHLFPDVRVLVQHSIGQGYYCEAWKDHKRVQLTESHMERLAMEMQRMVDNDLPILKHNLNVQDAMYEFECRGRSDKVELLRYRRNSRVNIYELNGYIDYYYGYMVPSTAYLQYFELKLYQNGFMLMFPDKDTRKTAEFRPSDKLLQTLEASAQWGIDMGVHTVGELNTLISRGRAQDLILIQEADMEQRMGKIAEQIAADKRKKFILVAGPSSSGKTTFSHRLSVHLSAQGLHPHPISMDDFYKNREDTPLDEFGEYDFECLGALDIELFNTVMTDLLAGKEVRLPVFNFKTGHREYRNQPTRLEKDDVLVIEGIHGLNEALSYQLPKESKFKIYISALTQLSIDEHNILSTTDGRLVRRMVRDARTRNTTAEQTLARWDSVRRGEEKNIFPYQEEADVMFNSALIYELSVLKLYAEPLLFSIESSSPQYLEAKRLLKFLDYFLPLPGESIGHNSILREFIGGSCFHV